VDINAFLGQEKGLDQTKLIAVANWRDSEAFTPVERDTLELADAMAATPSNVDEALFGRLLEALGKQGLVELTTAIGWENFRARTNRVFDAQSESYSDGAVCMLPARS
jgi:alkylhydroperoxidase family enzyme